MSLVNVLREVREPEMQKWIREEELRSAFDEGVEAGKAGMPIMGEPATPQDIMEAFSNGYALGELIANGRG